MTNIDRFSGSLLLSSLPAIEEDIRLQSLKVAFDENVSEVSRVLSLKIKLVLNQALIQSNPLHYPKLLDSSDTTFDN
jgi:hypothetical protein